MKSLFSNCQLAILCFLLACCVTLFVKKWFEAFEQYSAWTDAITIWGGHHSRSFFAKKALEDSGLAALLWQYYTLHLHGHRQKVMVIVDY